MNLKSVFSQKWAMRCFSRSLFLVFALTANSVFALSEPLSDVRVVIDVSGSMKNNDPKNLRAPALRMLVGLMPEKAKSGVWTFGKYVNMQVKHGKVTAAWKKLAMLESKKIHSRGLYTNIEEALKRSSQGWEKPNRKERRHLILLTDGMVDVSNNAQQNEASRKRILNNIVPQLKKAGVSIHTIALSENADKKLMAVLAGITDGWYEAVDNAEDLQRVFLHIFEKSTNVDSVPLEDNRFSIDKSIKDMTVLVFRKPGDSETKLITPDKKIWSYKKHPSAVKWHHDTGYDLISSKDPQAGQWLIKAAIDPDNRVMVVTNLKLVTGDFPNNVMYGDSLTLTAKLMQEGKTVTEEKLLKLVNFNVYKHTVAEQASVQDTTGNTIQDETAMVDDGNGADRLAKDGVYSMVFNTNQTSGDVSLTIQAKSPAFEREVRHIIKVHATPADLDIVQQADGQFKLEVTPRMELLVPHTISIQVTLPDGSKKILQQNNDDQWQVLLAKELSGQRVTVTLVGTRVNDKPFHADFDKILEASTEVKQSLSLDTPAADSVAKTDLQATADMLPPIPVAGETAIPTEPGKEKAEDVAAKQTESETDADKQEQGFNWLSTMMIIIYANIVFLILGGIGYVVWRKRKAKLVAEQEEMDL